MRTVADALREARKRIGDAPVDPWEIIRDACGLDGRLYRDVSRCLEDAGIELYPGHGVSTLNRLRLVRVFDWALEIEALRERFRT